MYDVVFVGAGIANLYAAWNYMKAHPNGKVVVLEKSWRVGGRVAWARFCGVEVMKGAGVGRIGKDQILLDLLQELNVRYEVSEGGHKNDLVSKAIKKLTRANAAAGETFAEFGKRVLGHDAYKEFVVASGYSDYESYDARVGLANYGFDDIYAGNKIFMFSWRELVNALKRGLVIKLGQEVNKISSEIVHVGKTVYKTRQIVLGVTHVGLKKLLPDIAAYNYIEGQPFMRVYANLQGELPMGGYKVVDSPLQKIIHIRDTVYMIAYADNKNALELRKWKQKDFEDELRRIFGGMWKIGKLVKYFWKIGTHYYKPGTVITSKMQNPAENIYVVGEVVADNQGWVGPALLTTRKINLN